MKYLICSKFPSISLTILIMISLSYAYGRGFQWPLQSKVVCEQFNQFQYIMLVGVLIILSSLILLELFLLLRLHKLGELGDYLAFTMIKLRISFASTPITFRQGLVDNIAHSAQLCSVRSINKVHKSLQIL
ncbi:Hypothetical_protein [Hexamita inflata]|uniref:Hypothetical_protein n=1 Tax=Hexamita inflata TaxID=28002 RepID=A0AA86PQB9_9EUKA|nr:Hypothetical protein HINF_LOCUS26827 [Hexamita inflata]